MDIVDVKTSRMTVRDSSVLPGFTDLLPTSMENGSSNVLRKTQNGSRKEYSSTLYAAYYDGKRSRVGTANELAKELGLTTNTIHKRVSRAMEGCKSAFDPVIVPTNTKYDTEEYVRSILKQGERKKPRANRPPNTQYRLVNCHTHEEIMVGTAKELAEYENVTVTAIKLRIRQKFKYNKWKPRVNFVEEIE